MERTFYLLAAINGFLAVAFGAFGAHGLKGRLAGLADGAQRLGYWETAAHYHLAHALALGLSALLASRAGSAAASVSGYAFTLGVLLFCGSLYGMALSGLRGLGAVTPAGGLCFLIGWAALAWAAFTLRS